MNKKESFTLHLKRTMSNGMWIFLLAMFIESLFLKDNKCYIVGLMLLFDSFLFFPWLKNILNYFNANIRWIQKLVIFVLSFIETGICLEISEKVYVNGIILTIAIILTWVLTISIENKRVRK